MGLAFGAAQLEWHIPDPRGVAGFTYAFTTNWQMLGALWRGLSAGVSRLWPLQQASSGFPT